MINKNVMAISKKMLNIRDEKISKMEVESKIEKIENKLKKNFVKKLYVEKFADDNKYTNGNVFNAIFFGNMLLQSMFDKKIEKLFNKRLKFENPILWYENKITKLENSIKKHRDEDTQNLLYMQLNILKSKKSKLQYPLTWYSNEINKCRQALQRNSKFYDEQKYTYGYVYAFVFAIHKMQECSLYKRIAKLLQEKERIIDLAMIESKKSQKSVVNQSKIDSVFEQ